MLSSTAWHQLTTPAGPFPDIARTFTAGHMPAGNLSVASESADQLYALYLGSWSAVKPHPVSSNEGMPTCPASLSGVSPAHQCAWSATLRLNIDLFWEQQVQTNIVISTDKYNPIRSVPQTHVNTPIATYTLNTCKHLKCYTNTALNISKYHINSKYSENAKSCIALVSMYINDNMKKVRSDVRCDVKRYAITSTST